MAKDVLDRIALADAAGPLNDLIVKLAGPDGASWLTGLKRLLRKEPTWESAHSETTQPQASGAAVWKTITLGLHKSPAAYLAAFEAKGNKISTYAGQILLKISFAKKRRKVDLYEVLDTDLGLTGPYNIEALLKAVAAHGYQKCPGEVGPALRDQYGDQPMNEYRLIAMDPVADSGGRLNVFNVRRNSDGSYLYASDARPGYRVRSRHALGRLPSRRKRLALRTKSLWSIRTFGLSPFFFRLIK